jgi:CPA2 family monovalent cation:H+ antiporter-2
MHLPVLIHDLAMILIVAAPVTLLCRWAHQPVVLGYLIAGFLVGPHFPAMPDVQGRDAIRVWADIGVIFLMFSLGLEFSLGKLISVGRAAVIVAIVEVFTMMGLGFLTGQALGWSTMDSVFLGGILAISSTTIIVRTFDELGLKKAKFVPLVYGVLIIEDLVAVLLLVLLASVAATKSWSVVQLGLTSVKLVSLLTFWFLLGRAILPRLLNLVRGLMTDETLLIGSLGLCLMMVLVANQAGYSSALGAFVMGSLLADTDQREQIEHLLLPIRDLFAAVFFVSVGMLIDPAVLQSHHLEVCIIIAITVVGKIGSTVLGARLAGQSWRMALPTGFSLAQIGEFSFIIATLGNSLQVTSHTLYPIAVVVSALTTFATPYLIRLVTRTNGI